MSALASFYLLDREDLGPLLEAAVPRRHEVKRALPFLKPKVVETWGFHSFLESHATGPSVFDASGFAFNDLDLLLEPRGASLFGPSGLSAESERLSAALKSSSALFDHDSARTLLGRLNAIELKPGELEAFLASEHGSVEPMRAETVLAAFAQAREWLAQVTPEGMGLLIIG